MSKYNLKLGRWGEQKACEYLIEKGYKIVQTNFRTEYGEIDIVAETDGEIVFIEVKTRTGVEFGNPEEAITPKKIEYMTASASAYMQEFPEKSDEWRMDVISILTESSRKNLDIHHFKNAAQG